MTTVTAHLTNNAYGFPTRGSTRRIKAPILACIHITGNRQTAANSDRHEAPRDERNYASRAGSTGPSAHYYVARDGWALEAIDPAKYARLVERRRRQPEHRELRRREAPRSAREGLQRQRGVLAVRRRAARRSSAMSSPGRTRSCAADRHRLVLGSVARNVAHGSATTTLVVRELVPPEAVG